MAGNSNLNEFCKKQAGRILYTTIPYRKRTKALQTAFQGKTVLCNCDDPYESNFFKYFAMNFNALGFGES